MEKLHYKTIKQSASKQQIATCKLNSSLFAFCNGGGRGRSEKNKRGGEGLLQFVNSMILNT